MNALRRLSCLVWLAAAAACAPRTTTAACSACHRGLEDASASHAGCVTCHAGNPRASDATAAHASMFGGGDRSSPERWRKGCGPCHPYQVARMESSQMFANAGLIAEIQATWEGDVPGTTYAALAATPSGPDGRPMAYTSVAALDNRSGELYRKFCATCHLALANDAEDGAGHPAGCAACHMPYAADATYRGDDSTMRGRTPHARTHTLQGLPALDACLRCHHRSGRIALAYQGLNDGNNALVPTRNGLPGPRRGSDDRSYTHIAPDVHFESGMECIDCHTSREIMGDGYAAADMHGQLEIRCEDCHGSYDRRPVLADVTRESDAPVRESRQYKVAVRPGDRVVLTSRGRPFSNVFESNGALVLATKRGGSRLAIKVITGTPEHQIAGHERLGCSACHARSVAQCYGCHTTYDRREDGFDAVRGDVTPGAFREAEDYRTLFPFPLALDSRGQVSPVTPGCQTFVTVVEADGRLSWNEYVARYKGRPRPRFAAVEGHNTGRRAIGCTECHANAAFLGFGQHVLERGAPRSTLLCERNPTKGLDAFLSVQDGRLVSHAAITRAGARPLDAREVRQVFAVNLCLVCHADAADPIYRSRLDEHALDDATHRRLLAADR